MPNFQYFTKYYLFEILHFSFQYLSVAGKPKSKEKEKRNEKRKRKKKKRKQRPSTIPTVPAPPLF